MQFQDIIDWMNNLTVQYGYYGIFVISLLGAVTILFPIPTTVVVFTMGGLKAGNTWTYDPIWIAVAGGIGSALGEFSGYVLGFGGRKAISKKYEKKIAFLLKVFNRFGPITIFLFALTPLPDDLLFIPLGVLRYNLVRAFIPALLGKFCMNLIVAYSGRFSVGIIQDIFGVESNWTTALIGLFLAFASLILVLVVMFKIDWEKYFEKHVSKKPQGNTEHK